MKGRPLKARRCRGCGEIKGKMELVLHEYQCLVSKVKPGDRFRTLLQTTYKGDRTHRRPVEVEILEPLPEGGWKVKSMLSGYVTTVSSPRRFLDWHSYHPGLKKLKKEM